MELPLLWPSLGEWKLATHHIHLTHTPHPLHMSFLGWVVHVNTAHPGRRTETHTMYRVPGREEETSGEH